MSCVFVFRVSGSESGPSQSDSSYTSHWFAHATPYFYCLCSAGVVPRTPLRKLWGATQPTVCVCVVAAWCSLLLAQVQSPLGRGPSFRPSFHLNYGPTSTTYAQQRPSRRMSEGALYGKDPCVTCACSCSTAKCALLHGALLQCVATGVSSFTASSSHAALQPSLHTCAIKRLHVPSTAARLVHAHVLCCCVTMAPAWAGGCICAP